MNRGAAVTIVVVLAITSGVTAAAVDMLAAYLWRPLPYPAADRLVTVDYPRDGGPSIRDLSAVDAGELSAIADLAVASDPDSFTVIGGDVPFTADGRWIGGDVFAMFGIVPALGRVFTREEAARGEPFVVIGYHTWQERFAGRDDVIGRTITVRPTLRRGEPETYVIVGVLPRRFWHIDDRTSLLLPLRGTPPPWLMRLRASVSIADAASHITMLVRSHATRVSPRWSVIVQPAKQTHVAPVRPMLAAAGVSLVLLSAIAAANLVFLQLARGVGRQREMAVRTVLGADRARLVRASVRESVWTGALAAVLGAAITFLLQRHGLPIAEHFVGRLTPAGTAAGFDPVVYLISGAATVVIAIGLGLIVHAASSGALLPTALAGTASSTDTPFRLTLRQAIVAGQVAVAFALLVGAALMLRTAWHLGEIDLGFEPRQVLSANLTLPETVYPRLDDRREFFRRLTERLEQLPEIEHAGFTGWLPFRVGPSITIVHDGEATGVSGTLQGVDAGYFRALGLRLREGRLLTPDDRSGRDGVAVVSQSLAREMWNGNALGRKFRIKFSPEPGRGFGPYTVVGVVDDMRQSVVQPTPPQVYTAFYQQPLASNGFLQLKTFGDPMAVTPAVERIVREMDRNLALGSITSLDALVDADGLRPRVLARGLAAVAVLAIALAMVGLYAVSAWIAQLRRREAALRVALGANRSTVVTLLARRGLIAVGAGLVAGWIATIPLAAMLAPQVRGVNVGDITTRVVVALVLGTISICAMFAPAWRISSRNLSALLRHE